MLRLPNTTLMGIDCVTPARTIYALNETLAQCSFSDVVLLTDLERNSGRHLKSLCPEIRLVHHKQSHSKQSCKLHSGTTENLVEVSVFTDYEIAVHAEPYVHSNTQFVLFHEWDACVVNPSAWIDEFFDWDYIGAPWPINELAGCHAGNSVGNGGFSLKSRHWCEVARNAVLNEDWRRKAIVSDVWACRKMRPQFEALGIRYAPESVARRFSCENEIYRGQFGFHGKTTAVMNEEWWSRWQTCQDPRIPV